MRLSTPYPLFTFHHHLSSVNQIRKHQWQWSDWKGMPSWWKRWVVGWTAASTYGHCVTVSSILLLLSVRKFVGHFWFISINFDMRRSMSLDILHLFLVWFISAASMITYIILLLNACKLLFWTALAEVPVSGFLIANVLFVLTYHHLLSVSLYTF